MIGKLELFAAWRAHLLGLRQTLLTARDAARAGTRVDGAHRPENRGERAAVTSQGYLTAGLGQRAAELDAELALLDRMAPDPRDRVVLGAVVHLEDPDGETTTLAILPGGDGATVAGVRVISPKAPLARALWGLREDDEATVTAGGRSRSVVVVGVA